MNSTTLWSWGLTGLLGPLCLFASSSFWPLTSRPLQSGARAVRVYRHADSAARIFFVSGETEAQGHDRPAGHGTKTRSSPSGGRVKIVFMESLRSCIKVLALPGVEQTNWRTHLGSVGLQRMQMHGLRWRPNVLANFRSTKHFRQHHASADTSTMMLCSSTSPIDLYH